jgi:hypothetical protein
MPAAASYTQQVLTHLREGPKFGWQIQIDRGGKDLNVMYRRRKVARSTQAYKVNGRPSYCYALPMYEGKTLRWEYQGRQYQDTFQLCPLEKSELKNRGLRGKTQEDVAQVLKECGALFPTEIFKKLLERGKTYNQRNVWKAVSRLKRKGRISVWDKKHGGWSFMYRGTLVALADDEGAFTRRLDTLDEALMTPLEKSILTKLRGAIYPAKELRKEVGVDDSLLSYIIRKFGRQAALEVKSEGTGSQYRIVVNRLGSDFKPEGRGLVSWVRYLNIFGLLVVWDDRIPEAELFETIKKLGYWASEEGKRRRQIGDEWEDYVEKWFRLVDQHDEWRLKILEARRKWKGSSKREFDRIFKVSLGPPELAISLYLIFEMKAGFISTSDIDTFYSKVINEFEFRNFATGGAKNNVMMIMVGAKSAEPNAFKKAAAMGMKIILHTSIEDVMERLTGDNTTFYKIAKRTPIPTPTQARKLEG